MYEVVVSTTRHVTPPVRRLARELSYFLWSAKRVNRGGYSFEELVTLARALGASRLVIVGRGLHGNPGRILFYDIGGKEVRALLAMLLKGVVFPPKLRSTRRPRAPVLVASTGSCHGAADDAGEDIAYALNAPFVGCIAEERISDFRGVRLLLVEHVLSSNLAYVLKFAEDSRELGLKILVRSVRKLGV